MLYRTNLDNAVNEYTITVLIFLSLMLHYLQLFENSIFLCSRFT